MTARSLGCINAMLFFLRNGQEAVAWIFFHDTVFWQVAWSTFVILLYFCEEVDSLSLATAQSYFGLVQVVRNAL